MSDEFDSKLVSLGGQLADYVAAAAKSILGAVPFAGSLLAEIAGAIIPQQRIDRIAKFAAILESKIEHLEDSSIRAKLTDENFTELTEEALRQAARSVTDERREYIASIIASGLSSEDIEFAESRHLLRILGEISDIEVIWLRFYLMPGMGGDEEFRGRHVAIITHAYAFINAPQETLDRAALQESYKEHLAQLNLLERDYDYTRPDAFARGGPSLRGYQITLLGKLLLRQIGLFTAENRPPVEIRITPLGGIRP